ncbi:MAG: TolC family protein [Reichenbachiella sp.]|uniref:TolC family protein n=1 Tax=Reichenbachiella sp. TaxID=2184521 RepID=UPI00326483CC
MITSQKIKWILSMPLFLWCLNLLGQGQQLLHLDSCLIRAENNYPLIRQYDLLSKAHDFNMSNLQKGKLPQLMISGQASYQSAVTSLPTAGSPVLSKDQYKLYGEIVQPLTDLMVINHQKKIAQIGHEIDQRQVEVQLYDIKERVSELFFGILLLQNQQAQIELTQRNLESGLKTIAAAVTHGTALKSSADLLKAELLTLQQKMTEIQAAKLAYSKMLGLFVDQELSVEILLVTPQVIALESTINRPELSLFDARSRAFDVQSELINKNNLPKFNLFLQSGWGRPALNFLSNDFEPFYIGGLRLSWRLSNYYSSSGQKQIYALNQQQIDTERSTFLFNTNLQLNSHFIEIDKMDQLIQQDEQIVDLREQIISTAKEQLAQGVITSNDYKSAVLDADQARQKRLFHEIELIRIKNRYKLTSGN